MHHCQPQKLDPSTLPRPRKIEGLKDVLLHFDERKQIKQQVRTCFPVNARTLRSSTSLTKRLSFLKQTDFRPCAPHFDPSGHLLVWLGLAVSGVCEIVFFLKPAQHMSTQNLRILSGSCVISGSFIMRYLFLPNV